MNTESKARKRAAIFDLDGTLVDSMSFVVETFIEAVGPFRSRPTREEVLSHLGGPLETCLRNVLGPSAAASFPSAMERLTGLQRGREASLVPYEGAKELLAMLASRGAKLGIWTGRDRWSTLRMMDAHGFAGLFGAVVCGDDLPTHKPDPEGLLLAIRQLAVQPHEVVFLGDADVDILGGHAAGVHTILIHHGRVAPAHVNSRAAEIYADPRGAYAAVAGHFE